MKARLLLGTLVLALLAAGCSSGEVKAEDVKGYQEAGRTAGDKVEKATPSSEDR